MQELLSKCKVSRTALAAVLLSLAVLPAGDATYMIAKARLAQVLINKSWHTTGNQPWPWADTVPVARLVIPGINLDNYVLDGATGATLAFGPGMVSGSARPGGRGVTMIAAHRDTHFEPLQHIAADSLVRIQSRDRVWHQYRVTTTRVADSRVDSITPSIGESRMVLVTCYPFDALVPGGPLRFVVEAELVGKPV